MLQIDTLLAFAIGLWYAFNARDAISRDARWTQSEFLGIANASVGLFLVPWAMYFFAVWPSWECFYWFSFTDNLTGNPLASLIIPAFALSMIVAVNLGFGLGHSLVRRDYDRVLGAITLLAFIGVVVILAANREALSWIGTTSQYRSPGHDAAVPLVASPFFAYFVSSSAVFILGLFVMGLVLKRIARARHLRTALLPV
jgi:hypothetical protein